MKRFFILLLLLFSFTAASAKKEIYYSSKWCVEKGGTEKPLRLSDGTFVDCLLPKYAVEADFAHKWYESIGQSLHYARMTGRLPAILLIVEKESEVKFIEKALLEIDYYKLPITVCTLYAFPGAVNNGLCSEAWDENGDIVNEQK